MYDVKTLVYNGMPLRIAQIDSKRWWSLTDVCSKALGYVRFNHIRKRLNANEAKTISIKNESSFGGRRMTFVNEDGLRKILSHVDKPESENFKRWLTTEMKIPIVAPSKPSAKPELQIKPSAEAGLQRAQMLIRIAEHKAVPKDEQLRLLSMAAKELTGKELHFESTEPLEVDSELMKLPEVTGFIKQKKTEKLSGCQLDFYPAEYIAKRIGVTAKEFDKLATDHKLKSKYSGIWQEVLTPQGKAREFMYLNGAPYFYRGNGKFADITHIR